MIKFLVIRLSSIGDIVLTSPLLRCLKNQVPDAEIHFVVKKQYKEVVAYNPHIKKVWLYHNNLKTLVNDLKKEKFHYVIDLHHNIRTFRIKNQLRVLSFSFNKLNIEKWLMVTLKMNRLPEKHIVERYIETLKLFNVKDDGEGLDYYISPEDEIFSKETESTFSEEFVALCIGAQHYTKRMPAEMLIKLCNKISLPVIILGGKEDEATAKMICSLSENKNITSLAGKISINQSAVVIKKSAVVITHDTGMMHIAAAFKKKILSIWGNTIPEFGMYPFRPGDGSYIFEVKGLSCRPCSKIGFRKCPKSHFKCMKDQDIEKIALMVQKSKETF